MNARAIKAQETRARIIAAATRLFQQRGYHGVGIAEVCVLAGAPKGLVYHHFPGGKAAIAVAALDAVADAIEARIATLHAEGLAPPAIVAALALAIADWGDANAWREGSIFAAFSVDLSGEGNGLHAHLAQRLRRLVALLSPGWGEADAGLALAALEGAAMAARALRDPSPLKTLSQRLAPGFRLDLSGDAP